MCGTREEDPLAMRLHKPVLQLLACAIVSFTTLAAFAPSAYSQEGWCMRVLGAFRCDQASAAWNYDFILVNSTDLEIDMIQTQSHTPGVEVSNGPFVPVGAPTTTFAFSPLQPGQPFELSICGFNEAAADSGEPYDCCRQTVSLSAPSQNCGAE